jgi:hypothetical protein
MDIVHGEGFENDSMVTPDKEKIILSDINKMS